MTMKWNFLHAGPGYLKLTELLAYLGISKSTSGVDIVATLLNGTTKEIQMLGVTYDEYYKGNWNGLMEDNKIEHPLYLQNQYKSYWYAFIAEENSMYFHFRRVNDQKGDPSIKNFTKALFAEIDEKRPYKLIIDFRHNNGGNYNKSRPLIDGIKARPWLNQKGKIWAITSRTTFSASSTTCIFLKQETNTTLIGEPGRTHPNKADNNEYMNLPNSKILVEHTTKIKKHWPELGKLDYIPVDVEVTLTFHNYLEGSDPVLDHIFK